MAQSITPVLFSSLDVATEIKAGDQLTLYQDGVFKRVPKSLLTASVENANTLEGKEAADFALANAALTAESGTGTNMTTPAVPLAPIVNIFQTIWNKIRQLGNNIPVLTSGTFTPTNGLSGTISARICTWKRYGNIVTVQIGLNSASSPAGGAIIANLGLPSVLLPSYSMPVATATTSSVGGKRIILQINVNGTFSLIESPTAGGSFSTGGIDIVVSYIID